MTRSDCAVMYNLIQTHTHTFRIEHVDYTIRGCEKREAHKNQSRVIPKKAVYLEDYWLNAGGLLAVNAIGTQLRNVIN